MRRIGWTLMALALILALTTIGLRYLVGDEPADMASMGFTIAVFLGAILLTISGLVRLFKGQVKLRPWEAFQSALLVFVSIVALKFLASAILPSLYFEWTDAAWKTALFAIPFGLYRTAYRKPA